MIYILSDIMLKIISKLICMFEWQRLYQLEARKFVISNVGPLGCIPYQRIINELNDEDCVDLANELATQYNSRLKDLVAELNDNLPGATFVLANVYDLVSELIVNYHKYGNNLVLEVFTSQKFTMYFSFMDPCSNISYIK